MSEAKTMTWMELLAERETNAARAIQERVAVEEAEEAAMTPEEKERRNTTNFFLMLAADRAALAKKYLSGFGTGESVFSC